MRIKLFVHPLDLVSHAADSTSIKVSEAQSMAYPTLEASDLLYHPVIHTIREYTCVILYSKRFRPFPNI